MIDALQRYAQAMRPARMPLIVLGGILVAVVVYHLLVNQATESPWIIPAMLGLLWCLSGAAMITAFTVVPARMSKPDPLIRRSLRKLHRGVFMVMALIWAAATIALAVLSFRLGAIWSAQF